MFFTYLAFSKNADQTVINTGLAGALWIITGANSLVLLWFIPLSNDYASITKNSEWWQIQLALIFGLIGFSILIQLAMDQFRKYKRDLDNR